MKRIAFIILFIGILLSVLTGCISATLVNTEREQVDAIVTKVSTKTRWEYHYVHVAYGSCVDSWYDEDKSLYDYFKNHLGETITCHLITYTYDNGTTKQELVFNEDLWKGKE